MVDALIWNTNCRRPHITTVPQLRTCTATPMDDWEDRYVGHWSDGVGTEIKVVKLSKHKFLVSYFRDGQPIQRPWMGDRPSIDMPATYIVDPLEGDDFEVELSGSNSGYALNLHYEQSDWLRPDDDREIISTAISGPSNYDERLFDACSKCFLCHEHLYRVQSKSEEP